MMYRATYLDYIFEDGCMEADTLEELIDQLKKENEKDGIMQVRVERFEPVTDMEREKILESGIELI